MMYGREPILPWEVEHDLGPLESVDVPELSLDEIIERMYNLRVQVFDVAAANTEQAQKVQARAYNAKHARNAFAVGEKVWPTLHCCGRNEVNHGHTLWDYLNIDLFVH